MLTTKMHLCLELDEILFTILMKLPLTRKVTTLAVSRKWREKSFVVLRQHKSVVLSLNYPRSVFDRNECSNHPVTLDNVIFSNSYHISFWKAVLSFLPSIEYVFLDIDLNCGIDVRYACYLDLLKHVIDKYGSQLRCLWVSEYEEQFEDTLWTAEDLEEHDEEEEFIAIDSLPELRDLYLRWIAVDDLKRILTISSKLEYFKCDTDMTEWNSLPKGFKKLDGDGGNLQGINTLLVSPAAETIEQMGVMQLTSETVFGNFWLPCLKVLHVSINETPNGCMDSLTRILRFSPVLTELSLTIEPMEDMEGTEWFRVTEECTRVTHFRLYIKAFNGNYVKVNSWQDDFACSMALNMKNLKDLFVNFALSSTGLTALSSLPQLEVFYHKLQEMRGVDITVFNEDALYSFLKTQFSRNLSHYEILITQYLSPHSYFTITQEFADRLIIMARNLSLTMILGTKFRECQWDYRKMRQPGMVYVTELKIEKQHQ